MFDIDLERMDYKYFEDRLNKARYMIEHIYEEYDTEFFADDMNDIHKENILKKWVFEEKRCERILSVLDWDTWDWNRNDESRPHDNERLEFSTFSTSEFDLDEIFFRSEWYSVGNYNSEKDCIVTDEKEEIKWDDVYKYRYVRY